MRGQVRAPRPPSPLQQACATPLMQHACLCLIGMPEAVTHINILLIAYFDHLDGFSPAADPGAHRMYY